MTYVLVPSNVKTKLIFNLTKRQLICFDGGALIGVPLFFLFKNGTGVSAALLVTGFSILLFPVCHVREERTTAGENRLQLSERLFFPGQGAIQFGTSISIGAE